MQTIIANEMAVHLIIFLKFILLHISKLLLKLKRKSTGHFRQIIIQNGESCIQNGDWLNISNIALLKDLLIKLIIRTSAR